MRLFDGHVATIKVIIIEINVNYFLVNKISKTISSHLIVAWRLCSQCRKNRLCLKRSESKFQNSIQTLESKL